MKWFLLVIGSLSTLTADIDYHKLIADFPETLGRCGSWKQGEIEIASEPNEIHRIEKAVHARFKRMGYSKEDAKAYSTCGIIAEDHYWIWIRDAVNFPGGIPGTYNRIVMKSGLKGAPGSVVLPYLESKKILLNIQFRHATRSWELELPRGSREEGETPKDAAARELKEETGSVSNDLIFLGDLAPETGIMSGTIPVFFARVNKRYERHKEESEAIAKNCEMTEKEIEEAFLKGYAIIRIKGQLTKVYCRDPYLSFALLQAKWRKLI